MKFKEKREYSRAEVEWPVDISAAQGLIQGTIKNMSLGGAYIHLEELPNMDENIHLSIEIPEHRYALYWPLGRQFDLRSIPVKTLRFLMVWVSA